MKTKKEKEIKLIFVLIAILFAAFLIIPVNRELRQHFINKFFRQEDFLKH